VLHAHEPPRQTGTHGDQREVKATTELLALFTCKVSTRVGKVLTVAGVAAEEPMKVRA
jgi:hypothetical protein